MPHQDPLRLPILDAEAVQELKDIMEEEFADLLRTYLEDLPEQLAAIAAAARQGDSLALLHSAHKLKSGSGSIGALRLTALTRQLEALGQSGATAGAEALAAQTRQAAEDTAEALRALL